MVRFLSAQKLKGAQKLEGVLFFANFHAEVLLIYCVIKIHHESIVKLEKLFKGEKRTIKRGTNLHCEKWPIMFSFEKNTFIHALRKRFPKKS